MASVRKVRLYINVIIILYIAGGSGEETLKKTTTPLLHPSS